MNIEFYMLDTGEVAQNEDLFVMRDKVWCDNYEIYESQQACIGFEDCIRECKDIGWRLTKQTHTK
jgi:hypothetical protein